MSHRAAIGNLGRVGIPLLYALDKNLPAIRDPDNPVLQKLKEAVFWSIKQCDTWDQFS